MSFIQSLKVHYFNLMKGEEKRLSYNLNEESIVFDLGSYHGEFALKIYKKYKCNIYCYEPFKEFFDYSQLTVKEHRIKFYNFALGSSEGLKKIYFKGDETSFFNVSDKSEEIKIKEFVKELNNLNIKKIDLIKINIEGAEYDFLDHVLKNNWQTKIQNFQIQFHSNIKDYKKRKLKIINQLKKTHKRDWYFPNVWESWGLK